MARQGRRGLPILLLLLADNGTVVARRKASDAAHDVVPRDGTLCRLTLRDILCKTAPQVHRLRFALPTVASGEPACCGGAGGGIVHVMIRAPAVFNQSERIAPYSATLDGDGSFSIVVKIYPGEPPAYAAVSAHLGSLPVGEYAHVPSIRAQDWRRDAARVGMLCFGVGLVECLHPAEALLAAGAQVRIINAARRRSDLILLPRLRALLSSHPASLSVLHRLSRPEGGRGAEAGGGDGAGEAGGGRGAGAASGWGRERTADGRVDAAAVASEFGTGAWSGGSTPPPPTHFYVVGTAAQEQAFLGMLFAAHLADPRSLRGCAKLPLGGCGSAAASAWRAVRSTMTIGHPPFLLQLGPFGDHPHSRVTPPHRESCGPWLLTSP
jgi:NAD(P)H-flavin reductase